MILKNKPSPTRVSIFQPVELIHKYFDEDYTWKNKRYEKSSMFQISLYLYVWDGYAMVFLCHICNGYDVVFLYKIVCT